MKICHFSSTTLDSHYHKNLSEGLADSGFDLLVGSLTEKKTPSWISSVSKTKYFCLNATRRYNYPIGFRRLVQILKLEKIDLLHTHLFDASLLGVLAAKYVKIPVIVSRHHQDLIHLTGHKVHVEIDRLITKLANLTVVPTVATRDFMISQESLNGEKIRVVNYGFDFNQFSATEEDRIRIRNEFKFKDDFVIGCVGHIQQNKGQQYLLKALVQIIKSIPEAKVFLLGRGEETYIQKLINENKLKDKVILGGYRQDVAACMKAMDVLVHTSLSESFGQIIIEAMSVGTPVVATPVGIVPEIIIDNETGFKILPKNVENIVECITILHKNPSLKQRITEKARSVVQERFTLERFVAAHLDCYHQFQ